MTTMAKRKKRVLRKAAYYRVPRYVGTEIPGALVRRIDAEADKDKRRRSGEVIVLLGEALDARDATGNRQDDETTRGGGR